MSQQNTTPDEQGHGSVATGQPPAEANGSTKAGVNGSGNGRVVDAAGGAEASRAPDAPPAAVDEAETAQFVAPANGDAGEATGEPATEPTTEPTPASDDAASAPTVEAPAPVGSAPAGSAPAAPDSGAEPTAEPAAPTERLAATEGPADPQTERLAATDGQPEADPQTAHPAATDGQAPAEADAGPALDPAPAVPAPGPAAAPPPPWRRLPGQDGDGPEAGSTSPASPASGLLDDGPTAFLEVPPSAVPDSPPAGEPRPGDTGSWARVPRSRPPRQAALQLKRLDPWSVLKLALVLAVVLFFIWLVAVGVLYGVLDGMGVWDRLNGTYADLVSGEAQTGSALISAGRVFGLAAVVGAINSLLFAVAVTVGAFVYNVSADLVGGIEVTLSERD